jgi:archaellum component FlaC
MSSPDHIVYTPCPDTSVELEAATLAAVYRYVLDCHAKKNAASVSGEADAAEGGGTEHGLADASE